MKTAVIYARYSSNAQTEQSIEGQLRVCNEYAKTHGFVIVDTYIDRATTGTNDNRLSFQKMLLDSKKRQFKYVLVYRLDRFARNTYDAVTNKRVLRNNGVTLISTTENIPDTPEGRLMESFIEGMNEYYSEELGMKIRRGLLESWKKGNTTGGKPIYGYDVINKKLVVNAHETQIVQEIFTKYAQGYKATAIADDLRERGERRKDGKLIDKKYIYYLLHYSNYTGKVEHQGVVYYNIFPQIISDELWYAVSLITEDNKLAPCRKKETNGYILSGKLYCGECKGKMRGESGTSQAGATHYYYLCSNKRQKKNECVCNPVKKEYLEDLVVSATKALLKNTSNIEMIAEGVHKVHEKMSKENFAIKVLEKEKAELKKKITNIIRAIEDGIVSDNTKDRLRELEEAYARVEIDLSIEQSRSYTFLTKDKIVDYLNKMIIENTDDIKARKLIVNAFIREVIYYEDKVIITYNFADNVNTDKPTKGYIEEIERQSKSAVNSNHGSCLELQCPPKNKKSKRTSFFCGCQRTQRHKMPWHCVPEPVRSQLTLT